MITLADIENLIIPDEFGMDEDDAYNEALTFVINQLEEYEADEKYTTGASKFVIFPEEKDIVVKIPFNGEFYYDYDTKLYDYFDEYFITDYCAKEEEMYFNAEIEGVEIFFAKTTCGGFTKNGTPYYISEKVAHTGAFCLPENTKPSEDSKKHAQELHSSLPLNWLALAIDFYGEEAVNNLLNFIDKYQINDLHNNNIGYQENGAPIIFDYSGFHS